jgi:hypothetical protein
MNAALKAHIAELTQGEPLTHKNLTVVPLFGPSSGPRVTTLVEALLRETAEVLEVGEGGRVPELVVVNTGVLPLLLLDGEELVGAKQNRILNTSLLVPPGRRVRVPVSCIERGRWDRISHSFASRESVMPSSLRAMKFSRVSKSVRSTGSYDAGQGKVWEEIDTYSRRRGVRSPTSALTDVLRADKENIDSYVTHFPAQEGQSGMAAYLDGRLIGLDLFGRADVFEEARLRLLRSYAADALARAADVRPADPPADCLRLHPEDDGDLGTMTASFEPIPSRRDRRRGLPPLPGEPSEGRSPSQLIAETLEAEPITHSPPGIGNELRSERKGHSLAALCTDEGLVHLVAFPQEVA